MAGVAIHDALGHKAMLDSLIAFVQSNPIIVFLILFLLYNKWKGSQPWPDFGGRITSIHSLEEWDALLAKDESKVVLVDAYALWCPPCKTAIPHLNELYRQHRGSGVQFVGVSAEAEGTVAPFIQQMGDNFTYPVALDPSRGCHDAFPSRGIPNAYVIGKDGCVAWTGHPMGDLDGAVRRALAQPAPGADDSGTGKGD